MRQRKYKFSEYPWHVILIALYPPLALLAHNIGEVSPDVAYRSMWVSVVVALLVFVVLSQLLRDLQKAGIVVALLTILFFSYGHIYAYLRTVEIGGASLGRHRYLTPAWLGLFLAGVWAIRRKRHWFPFLTSLLNTSSILLLIYPLYQLAFFSLGEWRDRQAEAPETVYQMAESIHPISNPPPDVYFIILDMYGRSDTLAEHFEYDNTAFLNSLRNLGFYVADCSQANYHSTAFSLAATLNMNYVNALADEFSPINTGGHVFAPLWQMIENNSVRAIFRNLGYRFITFETDYEWLNFRDADIFYHSPSTGITAFEDLLLRNSAALILDDAGIINRFYITAGERKREQILYVLDELRNTPSIPGPKFVFVHLSVPHPPFVFGPGGEYWEIAPRYRGQDVYYLKEDYILGYRNQAIFISGQVLDIVEQIIRDSERPPIIILQGDHGPSMVGDAGRIGILSAYYFPNPQPELYATLTPVNNFRLVFSSYFDADLPTLADRSYFTKGYWPYQYEDFPNECGNQQ